MIITVKTITKTDTPNTKKEFEMDDKKIEKTTLNVGTWWACIDKYEPEQLSIWHVAGHKRVDINVTKREIKDLITLANVILEKLEEEKESEVKNE